MHWVIVDWIFLSVHVAEFVVVIQCMACNSLFYGFNKMQCTREIPLSKTPIIYTHIIINYNHSNIFGQLLMPN